MTGKNGSAGPEYQATDGACTQERTGAESECERLLRELEQQRAQFEAVLRQMPVGVMIAEAPSGRVTYHNETSAGIFGPDSPAVESFSDYAKLQIYRLDGERVPPSEYPIARALFKGERVTDEELLVQRADGTRSFVSVNAAPITDAQGHIISAVAVYPEITDKLASAYALRQSEERLNLALDATEMGSCDMDAKTGKGIWNQQHFLLLGYDPPETGAGAAHTEMWQIRIHPEDRKSVDRDLERARSNRSLFRSEHRIIRADDGRVLWVHVLGRFLYDPSGEATSFIGVIFDVTESKSAEQKLRESEAALKLAIEATGLGIFDWDLFSGKAVCSSTAKQHFGLPPDAQVDAGTLLRGVHPEDRERVAQVGREALLVDGEGRYSVQCRTIGIEDGKERWISTRGQTFFDDNGKPVRFIGASLDITDIVTAQAALKEEVAEKLRALEELHRQEQLLIRQGRLAALGEMLANIAHQWRQPLNTLALIVQELPWYYDHDKFSKEYLDANVTRAMQVINHMSKTIDGFRNFFEPDKERVTFRVSDVLAQTLSMVQAAFSELHLEIEVHADTEIFLSGIPNEFSQVILNLLVNAKDALLERKVKSPRVVVRLFREAEKAVITVSDNAGGIPPEIVDKIFDPYFTTKGPDKGTGIGLFMSKTIIEKNMSGKLCAQNTGLGAEFRIEV